MHTEQQRLGQPPDRSTRKVLKAMRQTWLPIAELRTARTVRGIHVDVAPAVQQRDGGAVLAGQRERRGAVHLRLGALLCMTPTAQCQADQVRAQCIRTWLYSCMQVDSRSRDYRTCSTRGDTFSHWAAACTAESRSAASAM